MKYSYDSLGRVFLDHGLGASDRAVCLQQCDTAYDQDYDVMKYTNCQSRCEKLSDAPGTAVAKAPRKETITFPPPPPPLPGDTGSWKPWVAVGALAILALAMIPRTPKIPV